MRRMEGLRPAYESYPIYQFMMHDYDPLDSAVMDYSDKRPDVISLEIVLLSSVLEIRKEFGFES